MNYPRELISYLKTIGTVRLSEPMKEYTTFKCGGPADILIYPDGIESVPKVLLAARDAGIPVTVIGGGSNLLVGDRGIRGIVMRICGDGICNSTMRAENELIYCDASVLKNDFIDFSIEAGYEGVEFMAGIPGVIGGGIIMNAGTTMGSFIDILDSIDIVTATGALKNIRTSRAMTSYRSFSLEENAVITGGYFRLPSLRNRAGTRKIIRELMEERRNKHPLDYPSAGSVFKNPDGHSSWKLINDSGMKGAQVGGAMVSTLHTNFIINRDNARSADIVQLIEKVRDAVSRQFGITLETEIRFLGEF